MSANTNFLSQIQIDHGPVSLLGRFFLSAVRQIREYGIELSFASFEDLLEANRKSNGTWNPLAPWFNPNLAGFQPEDGYVLLGRNAAGEIVATQAGRRFQWEKTNFYEELTSMRFLYADPERVRGPGEACKVSAPSSRSISGNVVFSGASWHRPDYRGKLLSMLLPRISRMYAYARWKTDFTISMMNERVVAGRFAENCGYKNLEWSIDLINTPVAPGQLFRCALVWMEAPKMLADLESFVTDLTTERETAPTNGSAQQVRALS